jgi:hypothetical protein
MPGEHLQNNEGNDHLTQMKVEDDSSIIGPPETALGGTRKFIETCTSFKENPYSFLSPDDPILQLCM